MSHDIVNNEMAYVGDTPWHGLGVHLDKGANSEQMLKAAKLDWNVVTHPAFTIHDNKPIETGYQAIIREDTGQCFGMAGNKYTAVQNSETIGFFNKFCEAGDITLETVGAVRGGEYVWALAKINKDEIKIDNDTLNSYLLIANSHCPGHALTIKSTMIRVVCNNTLTYSLKLKSNTFGHLAHNSHIHEGIASARDYVDAALEISE